MIKTIFNKNYLLNTINILISLFICYALLILIKDFLIHFHKTDNTKSVTSPIITQEPPLTISDYERILKNNPFDIQASNFDLLTFSENKETTISDIKLVGTILGNKSHTYAILQDKNNSQEIFKIGEKVYDYGILKKVESDKVVIEKNSRLVEIPLQEIIKIEDFQNITKTHQTTSIAKSLSDGTFLVDKRRILQAIDNPSELLTDARLQPNFIDGRQEGFILREVRNNGIYSNLGLQDGDVLLKINDYSITNPESALQAFYAIRGLETIKVDIIRDRTRKTLTYIIK